MNLSSLDYFVVIVIESLKKKEKQHFFGQITSNHTNSIMHEVERGLKLQNKLDR